MGERNSQLRSVYGVVIQGELGIVFEHAYEDGAIQLFLAFDVVTLLGLIGAGDDEAGVRDPLVLGAVAVSQVVLVLAEDDLFVASVVLVEVQVHHRYDERAAVIEHGAEGIIIGVGLGGGRVIF